MFLYETSCHVSVNTWIIVATTTGLLFICMYCQIVTFHCVSVNRWCLAHGHANFVRTSTVSVDAAPAQIESERRYFRTKVFAAQADTVFRWAIPLDDNNLLRKRDTNRCVIFKDSTSFEFYSFDTNIWCKGYRYLFWLPEQLVI